MDKNATYYVGMSGGVDSTVVAYLLVKQQLKVKGIFANCFYGDEQCRNGQDHRDAVDVSAMLGIQLVTKDYRTEYRDKVLARFYDEYANGRTPNPDILCNSEIKFGVMANDVFVSDPHACLATGHYVSNRELSNSDFVAELKGCSVDTRSIEIAAGLIYGDNLSGKNFLFSGIDALKDQSYFLYRLYDRTKNLHRYVFPLGGMNKAEVRALAGSAGLSVAEKPDSQGICFVGDIKIREFISSHIKSHIGAVLNTVGDNIGSHMGVEFYTIGQRHGFKVDSYTGEPLYIVSKDFANNLLTVGTRDQASTQSFKISDCSFPYSIEDFLEKFNGLGLTVRVRNLGRKIPCKVSLAQPKFKGGKNGDPSKYKTGAKIYQVDLLDKEFGVSDGQSAVFYLGSLMLGGGVIGSGE